MQSDTTRAWSPRSAKLAVSLATACVGVSWFLLAVLLLLMVVVFVGVLSGILPTQMCVSTATLHLFLGCMALFVCCGSVNLVVALRLHCPHCGFKFLKNPKGLGPVGFVYHPNCPRKPGLNPWAVQIGRFLATGKIRCINCGEEVFG
jgi:hypothetical protein